ncbi:MAG TPA: porin family protein [Gallionellaceae bacterium]|nr:porin family protein [Gallionellaceae bacterium]
MKKILAVALLSTCISTPTFAADNSGSFYGAIDSGALAMANWTLAKPSSLSFSAGYHFSPIWAVEGGYTSIGESSYSSNGTGNYTYSQSMWNAVGVGTYAVNDSFEVFGKLGLGSVSAKAAVTGTTTLYGATNTSMTANTNSVIYGIGAQYNFSKRVGIRAQYESLGKSTADSSVTGIDLTRTSVGLVYNF